MPVDGINTLNYLRIVTHDENVTFVNEMRALGGIYSNFTLTTRNQNNSIIDFVQSPVYFPLTMAYPPDMLASVIGFDSSTRLPNGDTIRKALLTNSLSATGKTVSVNALTPSIIIYAPVCDANDSEQLALAAVALRADRLVEMVVNDTPMRDDGIIFMFDHGNYNASTFKAQERIMYSNLKNLNAKLSTNLESVSEITEQMLIDIMRKNEAVRYTIDVADRLYLLSFIPTDSFINRTRSVDKWIGLIVPMILSVLFVGGALIFARVIYYNRTMMVKDHERVVILEEQQQKLQELLNKIAIQDKKTRQTINAIQDFVIITNTKGRILSTNSIFDTTFAYKSTELEKGIYIGSIFPQLERLFFVEMDPNDTVDTVAKTRFLMIPVQVSVSRILEGEEFESAKFNEEDEAYLIVARNMTDQEQLRQERKLKEGVNNKIKWVEFDSQFKIPSFKKALLKFCQNEKNAENVLFLEAVSAYKKKRVDHRVDMQREIYNRFVKVGAPMQLNIEQTTSEHFRVLVNKRLGDEDIFDPLEDMIKTLLMQDVYPRFIKTFQQIDLA
jgi:PAS domain-containing protein